MKNEIQNEQFEDFEDEVKDAINSINYNNVEKAKSISRIIALCKDENINFLLNIFKFIKSDFDKTYILLNANRLSNSNKQRVLSLINNQYYRIIIVKQIVETNFTINDLIPQLMQFFYWEQEINKFSTEEEKTKYISNIYDNDAKIALLAHIKEKANREIIINSLKCYINSNLKPYVLFVQEMIEEWVEDCLIDKTDSEKLEKMRSAFKRTSVELSNNLEQSANGKVVYLPSKMYINSQKTMNKLFLISCLLHEYSHIFTNFNCKDTMYCPLTLLDEGMADVFAELVMNHYINKHKKIEVNGKKIRVDVPFIKCSGYDMENGVSRTMLFPLDKKGVLEQAVIEWILGDKSRYIELCLGKETADRFDKDDFGNIIIDIYLEELFKAKEQYLNNVDRNSFLYRRNDILPFFQLQAKIGINKLNIVKAGCVDASILAKAYFGDKKIFEISKVEIEEFETLLDLAGNRYIENRSKYLNERINEITYEDVKKFSFEILNNFIPLLRSNESWKNMESLYLIAFEIETSKIETQSLGENLRKYNALYDEYYKILTRLDPEFNIFSYTSDKNILAALEDFQFGILNYIEAKLQEGKKEEVIDALSNEFQSKSSINANIVRLLSQYGIDYKYEVTTEDILNAASRAGLEMGEIRKI